MRTSGRLGTWVLGGLAAVALLADILASDLPLACRYQGRLYVLPSVFRPGRLRGLDNQTLERTKAPGDWIVAPPIPYGPNETVPGGRLELRRRPSSRHLLGTDEAGRDVAAQLVHGTRSALLAGVLSVLVYLALGALFGGLAGWLGGAVDRIVTWAVAVLVTFPTLLVVLAFQAALGGSLWSIVLVIGLTGWPNTARLVRAVVRQTKSETFVLAARAGGVGWPGILWEHVLPRAGGLLAVSGAFGVAWATAAESAISFLGLAGGYPSWGRLLASGRTAWSAWWIYLPAGAILCATLVAAALLAEGLRERFGRPAGAPSEGGIV